MTTKQAAPATLDQAQTWIDALRYDLGDAQNECIKVRADNKRLMAEREQLVAALRIARAALVREGHHPQHSGILIETIDPLLARLGAE